MRWRHPPYCWRASPALRAEDKLAAITAAADGPVLTFFPVAGWLKAAAGGAIGGEPLPLVLGLGRTAAYIAALVLLITRTHPDFYEDVLKATEISFSAVTASKEGRWQSRFPRTSRWENRYWRGTGRRRVFL